MTRKELNQKFKDLGIRNVYFQPPESLKISYPCLIYSLTEIRSFSADDFKYKLNDAYMLTYVSKSPTDQMVHTIASLPMCTFDRFYTAEGLNHYVYTLYV